jgi:hypothetical protein
MDKRLMHLKNSVIKVDNRPVSAKSIVALGSRPYGENTLLSTESKA